MVTSAARALRVASSAKRQSMNRMRAALFTRGIGPEPIYSVKYNEIYIALGSRKNGGGLPQSKTWRKVRCSVTRDSVLECASPLALLHKNGLALQTQQYFTQ